MGRTDFFITVCCRVAEGQHVASFPAMKQGCHFKHGGIASGIFPYAVSGKVFPLPAFRLEIVFGRHKRDILRLACA